MASLGRRERQASADEQRRGMVLPQRMAAKLCGAVGWGNTLMREIPQRTLRVIDEMRGRKGGPVTVRAEQNYRLPSSFDEARQPNKEESVLASPALLKTLGEDRMA